jgi:hypothetical protein
MLKPDQFTVNEAWIATNVYDLFITVKNEPYDIYIGSMQPAW